MSKGTYDVQKGEVERPNRRDSSYRSFLCAILIFLILCVIIIIVGNWKNITGDKKKSGYENARKQEHEVFSPNEDMEFFQKFRVSSTETQQNLTTKSYFRHSTTTPTAHHTTTRKTTKTTENPANQTITTEHQITTRKQAANENSAHEIITGKPTPTKNSAHQTTTARTTTTENPQHQNTTRKPTSTENSAHKTSITRSTTTENSRHHITTRKPTEHLSQEILTKYATTENRNITTDNPIYKVTTPKYQSNNLTTANYLERINTAKEYATEFEEDKKLNEHTTKPGEKQYELKTEKPERSTTATTDTIKTTTFDSSTTLLIHEDTVKTNVIITDNNLQHDTQSTTELPTSDTIGKSTTAETVKYTNKIIFVETTEMNNINNKTSEASTVSTNVTSDSISSYVTRRGKEKELFEATMTDVTTDSTTADITKYIIPIHTRHQEADVVTYSTTDKITEDFTTDPTNDITSDHRKYYKVVEDKDSALDSTTETTEDNTSTHPRYNQDVTLKYGSTDSTTEAVVLKYNTTDSTTEGSITDSKSEDSTTILSTENFTTIVTEETASNHRRYNEVVALEDSSTVSTTADSTTDSTDTTTEDFTTRVTENTSSNHRSYDAIAVEDSTTDSTAEDSTTISTTEDTTTDASTENSTTELTTEDTTTDASTEDTTTDASTEDSTTELTTDDTTTDASTEDNTTEFTTEDFDYTTFTESTTYKDSTGEDEENKIKSTKTEDTSEDSESTTQEMESTTDQNYNNVTQFTPTNYQLTPRAISVESLHTLKDNERVCKTRGCKSVSSGMLNLMNDNEDACEDFYVFACGGSPHTQTDSAVWDILLKQTLQIKNSSSPHLVTFRSFYNSCTDFHYRFSYHERVNKVKMLLESYGMESFQSAKVCEMDYIFQKLLSLNSMYFMEVGVEVGNGDDQHILQLGPSLESSGEIGPWSALRANQRRCLAEQRHKIYDAHLNLEKIHESYAECLEGHTEFRQLLHDAIEAFGYGKNEEINLHYTINYLNKLLGIRPSKAEIFMAKTNRNFTTMTVTDLQRNFPQVNWKNIFSVVRGKDVDSEQKVHVYFQDYLARWFEIFSSIKEKKWLLINILITDLYYNFVVHKVNNDVQNYCLKTSAAYLSDIASNLYLNNFPDASVNKHEKRVQDIFHVLKSTFHKNLKNSTEFSDIASYLDNMSVVFSTKRELASDDKLVQKYQNFGNYSSYQEYLLKAKEFKMNHLGDVFGGQVNAFDRKPASFYQRSKIYVPLGMVVDIPFNLPDHIILAKIGIKLAQSIAKHFDPVSITLSHPQLTKKNSYDGLISNADTFLPYIEKKFNKFTVKVNAALTINERMSDNTALRLLTEAHTGTKNDSVVPWISSSYPREKVMFVAVAQEFCDGEYALDYMVKMYEGGELPGAVRVYNMFMNSEAFAKAFGCAQGSAMNENPMKAQFPFADNPDQYADYYTT